MFQCALFLVRLKSKVPILVSIYYTPNLWALELEGLSLKASYSTYTLEKSFHFSVFQIPHIQK